MILTLASAIYSCGLLLASNRELRAGGAPWRTALLSLGLTRIEALWQAVAMLARWLSPFEQPRFDRANPVHRAAGLLLMAHVAWSLWILAASGQSEADKLTPEPGAVLLKLAAATAIYLLLAALGTGWRIRRDLDGVRRRLGLSAPGLRDCLAGLTLGLAIYAGMLFSASVLPSTAAMDESGARLLFATFERSLPAALLLAILAGAGEEILYRGALQPVFGLVLTSVLFTLLHTQYGFSREMLILFFVSLGFGLTRRRFNTTVAIIAHAAYDFAPFLLIRLLPV